MRCIVDQKWLGALKQPLVQLEPWDPMGALAQYLQFFSWPVYGSMIALTVITSFAGAWLSMRILKKHFEKAGMI